MMRELRPARWNVISACTPFVGFLGGLVVGTAGQGVLWHGHPAEGLGWGVAVWAMFSVFGLVAATLAWVRAERLWGITAFGIILNAPVPLVFFWVGLSNLLNWLRYG